MTTISIAVTITVEAPSVHTGGLTVPTPPLTLAGVREVVLGALAAVEDVPVMPEPKAKRRPRAKKPPPLPESEPLPVRDVYSPADAGGEIFVERIGADYHWTCWRNEEFCSQSERGWARPNAARVAGNFHTAEMHGGAK